MRNLFLFALTWLVIAVVLFVCSVRTPAPVTVVENQIVIPQTPEPSGDSAVYAHPLVGEGTLEGSAFGGSGASLSDGEVGNEADQLTTSDLVLNEPAEIPAVPLRCFIGTASAAILKT